MRVIFPSSTVSAKVLWFMLIAKMHSFNLIYCIDTVDSFKDHSEQLYKLISEYNLLSSQLVLGCSIS